METAVRVSSPMSQQPILDVLVLRSMYMVRPFCHPELTLHIDMQPAVSSIPYYSISCRLPPIIAFKHLYRRDSLSTDIPCRRPCSRRTATIQVLVLVRCPVVRVMQTYFIGNTFQPISSLGCLSPPNERLTYPDCCVFHALVLNRNKNGSNQ